MSSYWRRREGIISSIRESLRCLPDKEWRKEAVRQSDTSYTAVSSQGDTVTVSEAGKAANSNMGNQTGTDGTVTKKNVEEYLMESESSESSNSTINLSGYTETELKQMYLDGDITKA